MDNKSIIERNSCNEGTTPPRAFSKPSGRYGSKISARKPKLLLAKRRIQSAHNQNPKHLGPEALDSRQPAFQFCEHIQTSANFRPKQRYGHCVIGDLFSSAVRDIANRDAIFCSRCNIDVVKADTTFHNNPAVS
jgi:hypothetical protein